MEIGDFAAAGENFGKLAPNYVEIRAKNMKELCIFQAESLKNSPAAAKSLISVYFQFVLLMSEFLRELIFCMNCYLYFRVFFEFLREQTLFISEFLYYSRRAAVTSKPKSVPHMYDSQCFYECRNAPLTFAKQNWDRSAAARNVFTGVGTRHCYSQNGIITVQS